MDDSIKYIWGAFVTITLPLIGFFTTRTLGELDGVKKKTDSNELELERYKTHVSDNYAKDASVQTSLARIHDRMDSGFGKIEEDIKILIAKTK